MAAWPMTAGGSFLVGNSRPIIGNLPRLARGFFLDSPAAHTSPTFPGGSLGILAAAYAAKGQGEKARAVMNAFLEKKPGRTTLSNFRSPRLYKRKED